MTHSPEPWTAGGQDGSQIVAANGEYVADWCVGSHSCEELGDYITPENIDRIVACVNACKGIPTEDLEQHGISAVHKHAAEKIAKLYEEKIQGLADRMEEKFMGQHLDTENFGSGLWIKREVE